MSNIAAIETEYKGYKFRSRLEARYAVLFDSLGVKWQYEPEGYELQDGSKYLPDFYLPEANAWIEIKGVDAKDAELEKMAMLVSGKMKRDVSALDLFSIGSNPMSRDMALNLIKISEEEGETQKDALSKVSEHLLENPRGYVFSGLFESGWCVIGTDYIVELDPLHLEQENLCKALLTAILFINKKAVDRGLDRSKDAIEASESAIRNAKSARFEYGHSGAVH